MTEDILIHADIWEAWFRTTDLKITHLVLKSRDIDGDKATYSLDKYNLTLPEELISRPAGGKPLLKHLSALEDDAKIKLISLLDAIKLLDIDTESSLPAIKSIFRAQCRTTIKLHAAHLLGNETSKSPFLTIISEADVNCAIGGDSRPTKVRVLLRLFVKSQPRLAPEIVLPKRPSPLPEFEFDNFNRFTQLNIVSCLPFRFPLKIDVVPPGKFTVTPILNDGNFSLNMKDSVDLDLSWVHTDQLKQTICKIINFRIYFNDTSLVLEGNAKFLKPALMAAKWSIGPWVIVIEGVRLMLEGAGDDLKLNLEINRLSIRSNLRPETELAASLKLVLTGENGIKLETIALVKPTMNDIKVIAASFLSDLSEELLDIRVKITIGPESKLLETLSELAVSAGQSIGNGLTALARTAMDLTESLMRSLNEAVVVQIRLSADTWAIKQVLLAPASGNIAPKHKVAGLEINIPSGCRPALLINCDPFAISLLAIWGKEKPELSLSTDLWLRCGNETSLCRDMDTATGKTPDKPLLQLTVAPRGDSGKGLAVFSINDTGLQFLQRLSPPLPPLEDAASSFFLENVLSTAPLDDIHTTVKLSLNLGTDKDRLLPFLSVPPSVAHDDTQYVTVTDFGMETIEAGTIHGHLGLNIVLLGMRFEVKAKMALTLSSLSVSLEDSIDVVLPSGSPREFNALDLNWKFIPDPKDQILFYLDLREGDGRLVLADDASIDIGYNKLSRDGNDLKFSCTSLQAGGDGLFLEAAVTPEAVKLRGIDTAFRFSEGTLRIERGILVGFEITGSGVLPPDLVGDAKVKAILGFRKGTAGLELHSAHAVLEKAGDPLFCAGTRLKLFITQLGLNFVHDQGYHLYFTLSGEAQFTPNPGEFTDGLLKHIATPRITLDRVPLAADASVLAQHISFLTPLSPPIKTKVFDTFTFELRGIALHPSCSIFNGDPAMELTGQVYFSEGGDTPDIRVDFHAMYLAPGNLSHPLPRVNFEGLGVNVSLGTAGRISGNVCTVDDKLGIAPQPGSPPPISSQGFLGSGQISLQGLPSLSVALGFLDVEKDGQRGKALFLYVQRDKISYPMPVPVITLYLREVGLGLGYRFTLDAIRQTAEAKSYQDMIDRLDEISKHQGELATYQAWAVDMEKPGEAPRLTAALRGCLSMASASPQEAYNESKEKDLPNPLLFDIVAALRSDLTFLINLRGWLSTNYHDFFNNRGNLRHNPPLRGYMFISVPRKEILARCLGKPGGYIGDHPPLPPAIKNALNSIEYEATLFVRPGLFHFELGWPNKLSWTMDAGILKLSCRGGLVYRIRDQAMLMGMNIEGSGSLSLAGRAGGSSLGACISATADISIACKMLSLVDAKVLTDSLFYGRVLFSMNVKFSVSAWMEVDLWLTTIEINIGFSQMIQVDADVQIAISGTAIGARAKTYVSISVFGCRIGIGVSMAFNDGHVDKCLARVERFLDMDFSADTPEPSRYLEQKHADQSMVQNARRASIGTQTESSTVPPTKESPTGTAATPGSPAQPQAKATLGEPIQKTDFSAVLYRIKKTGDPNTDEFLMTLLPRQYPAQGVSTFYTSPIKPDEASHILEFSVSESVELEHWENDGWAKKTVDSAAKFETHFRWHEHLGDMAKSQCGRPLVLLDLIKQCFIILPDDHYLDPAPRHIKDNCVPLDHHAATKLRNRAAVAEANPNEDGIHSLRSMLLLRFASDLRSLGETLSKGDDFNSQGVHLVHTGLCFKVKRAELEKLISTDNKLCITVKKQDTEYAGDVYLLNHPDNFFDNASPKLDNDDAEQTASGVELKWNLVSTWEVNSEAGPQYDPEHHLLHYQISRTVSGVPDHVFSVTTKTAATEGVDLDDNGKSTFVLFKPTSQFSDTFSDLGPVIRRALCLPQTPEEAKEADEAWNKSPFQNEAKVLVIYQVTPVDVSGTLGRTQTIQIAIPRPLLRPLTARAELQFTFKPTGSSAAAELDASNRPKLDIQIIDKDKSTARKYILWVRQERILPSGSYGSSGLTDRRRGYTSIAGAAAPDESKRPDEACFLITSERPDKFKEVRVIGPNDDVPYYFDEEEFLTILKGEDGQRMASRFFLQVQETYANQGDRVFYSDRTPASFTLDIAKPGATDKKKANDVEQRAAAPELFEWPDLTSLPALPAERVMAFASRVFRFLPKCNARLSDFAASPANQTQTMRDPLRRMGLEFRISCLPTENDLQAKPGELSRRQLVAGYDVREVDLHNLPPHARESEEGEEAELRKRSCLAARIHLLPRSLAMLTPSGIGDPNQWEAFYPSWTWRVQNTGTQPRAWYSTRESLPAWPGFGVRRGLVLDINNADLAELFKKGFPTVISAKLLHIDKETENILNFDGDQSDYKWSKKIIDGKWSELELRNVNDGVPISPSQLRQAIFDLTCNISEAPSIEGYSLQLVVAPPVITPPPSVKLPLDFSSRQHPLLEELLSKLRWYKTKADTPYLYPRYTVDLDTFPSPTADSVEAFLTATGPETDPYGWNVLRSLGLSVCFRLVDDQTGDFVQQRELLRLVGTALDSLLEERYQDYREDYCEPVVEILTRPGGLIRLADDAGSAGKTSDHFLDDECLAMVQVSLRPSIFPCFTYYKVKYADSKVKVRQLTITAATDTIDKSYSVAVMDLYNNRTGQVTKETPSLEWSFTADEAPCAWQVFLRLPPRGVITAECDGAIMELVPIKSPANQTGAIPDIFERFDQPEPRMVATILTGMMPADKPDPWRDEAWDNLMLLLNRAYPGLQTGLRDEDRTRITARYLGWAGRFLEHATVPETLLDNSQKETSAHGILALATPKKGDPWQLAPDKQGRLRLVSYLPDRLAHLKSYVVLPRNRYASMAEAAGYTLPMPEGAFKAGHRVDVAAPRTAALTPPQIISSRRVNDPTDALPRPGKYWELIIAPHSEQVLSDSNRSLSGRLEFAGVMTTLVREYAHPEWKARIKTIGNTTLETSATIKFLPPCRPALDASSYLLEMSEAHPGGLIDRNPDLWHGAEVLRLKRLPYYYVHHFLAAARAGTIVSPVTAVSQREFHYTLPSSADAPKGSWCHERDCSITLDIPLLRHRDCLPKEDSQLWAVDGSESDLPDPEVLYQLEVSAKETDGDDGPRTSMALVQINARELKSSDEAKPPYECRSVNARVNAGIGCEIYLENTATGKELHPKLRLSLKLDKDQEKSREASPPELPAADFPKEALPLLSKFSPDVPPADLKNWPIQGVRRFSINPPDNIPDDDLNRLKAAVTTWRDSLGKSLTFLGAQSVSNKLTDYLRRLDEYSSRPNGSPLPRINPTDQEWQVGLPNPPQEAYLEFEPFSKITHCGQFLIHHRHAFISSLAHVTGDEPALSEIRNWLREQMIAFYKALFVQQRQENYKGKAPPSTTITNYFTIENWPDWLDWLDLWGFITFPPTGPTGVDAVYKTIAALVTLLEENPARNFPALEVLYRFEGDLDSGNPITDGMVIPWPKRITFDDLALSSPFTLVMHKPASTSDMAVFLDIITDADRNMVREALKTLSMELCFPGWRTLRMRVLKGTAEPRHLDLECPLQPEA